MKNIPSKIYLQVDADGETPEDFKELEVTWATDRIFKTDIEYVRNVDIIDWVILRELFFSDCTRKDSDGCVKVDLAPHDLFNWFKKQIPAQ